MAIGKAPGVRTGSGFTLVELLLVVLIVAILAGLAVRSRGDNGQLGLELFQVQLQDAVSYAKSLARSNRKPHGIKIDLAADAFAIIDADGELAPDPHTKRGYVVALTAPGQPNGLDIIAVDFGSAGASMLFDAQGFPLVGGTITVRSRKQTATYSIDAATGRVTRL